MTTVENSKKRQVLRLQVHLRVHSDPLNQWYSVCDMKLIIVKGVEHLLGEGVWNPLQRGRKGHPTQYMYMFHNYKLITNNVNIPFTHDSDSTG